MEQENVVIIDDPINHRDDVDRMEVISQYMADYGDGFTRMVEGTEKTKVYSFPPVHEKKQPVQKHGTRAQRRAEEKRTKKLMKKYHKQQAMIERIGREQFRGNDVVSAE